MRIDDIKPDWDNVKKRYKAWWSGELHDRVMIHCRAPKRTPAQIEPLPNVSPVNRWTDMDFMIKRVLHEIATTYYAGESLPFLSHHWSVGHAVLLGCKPHFAENTVWTECVDSGGGYPEIRVDWESPWWKWIYESTLEAANTSQGRYWLMQAWGNHSGDTLALVRGTQTLMMDIIENPDWVKRAVKQVSSLIIEFYDKLWPMNALSGMEGSLNYVGLWSPGKTVALDFDLSVMVAPRVFEEMFLPPLVEHARRSDHVIYHLDGTLQIPHLDMLLDVPEIHAIQWVPGYGQYEIEQWIPLIRRIQSKGKSIVVYAKPAELEMLLGAVNHEGLCISLSSESEEEADQIIRLVQRRSKPSIKARQA